MSRFLHGTPAVPALYAAQAGYAIVEEVGVKNIRDQSVRQVGLLLDLARGAGLVPKTPARAEERGGMVILDVPRGEAVTRELLRREILVDHPPGAWVRLSPQFYTTDDELQRVISEIRTILDSGAERAHLQAGGTGF